MNSTSIHHLLNPRKIKSILNFNLSSRLLHTISAPNPLPSYVYKILPNTAPYQGTPIPIPSSWRFPKTQSDLDDGFVHLSTLRLLPGTLMRFFSPEKYTETTVQLLKVDFKRLSAWKKVAWERARDGENYPHLYGTLTGEEVRELKVVDRGDGWEGVCKKLEAEGWLED